MFLNTLALDIYKQENGNNNDATSEDLSTKLAKAKKIEWLLQKETKLAEYNSLQTYLKDLITKDTNVDVNAKDQQIDIMNRCIKDKKNEFATPEIPEHFTCKISFVNINNSYVDWCLYMVFIYRS